MSFKDVLLDFFVSEEASVGQRSALQFGSMLTLVMLVAMVTVAMTPVPAQASCCILVHGSCCDDCGSWSYYPCNPNCNYVERSCREGCIEYYYACSGGNSCYANCN